MKKYYVYLLVIFFHFSFVLNLFSQNDISITSVIDSTIVGYDVPLEISLNETSIQPFQIKVLTLEEGLSELLPKIDSASGIFFNSQNKAKKEIKEVDFEISDFGIWKGDGKTIIPNQNKNNTIKIKIWDSNIFMILPVLIQNNDTIYPDKLIENLQNFGSGPVNNIEYPEITVLPTLNPKDTIKDFTPIKNIIKEEKNWKDYLLYIYIGIGLLLLLLAAIFLPKLIKSKKKTETIKKEKIILPPAHIIALKKLNTLEKEQIWKDESRVKEYQSSLTHILREYLENRFGIKALEQTTGEITDTLTKLSISNEDNNTIKNILEIADLVKFAKAKPGEDLHKKFLDDTIDFVNRTKKEEEKTIK